MKAVFVTLGCKVNQYETQVLSQQFAAAVLPRRASCRQKKGKKPICAS